MRQNIQIGRRKIGKGQPCFIIAEAGSNHNGNFEQALRLVDTASEAGADAVKFQNFRARKLYPPTAGRSDYLKIEKDIFEIIREMEMPDDWAPRLAKHCDQKGIVFLSTPFHEEAVDMLDPYVPAFKISSCDLTHTPFIERVVGKRKPIILSTGCADMEEIVEAVRLIERLGHADLVLLQCTGRYPAPMETLNLRTIPAMRERTGCLTGLSDHSRDPIVGPVAAVAMGACVLEKHFTLGNKLPGPDHVFAVEPGELAAMVRAVREAEAALGSGDKTRHEAEEEIRAFARRSVFSIRPIRAGEVFTSENTAILRNGKHPPGLPPKEHGNLLGKVAAKAIQAFDPIAEDAVARPVADP